MFSAIYQRLKMAYNGIYEVRVEQVLQGAETESRRKKWTYLLSTILQKTLGRFGKEKSGHTVRGTYLFAERWLYQCKNKWGLGSSAQTSVRKKIESQTCKRRISASQEWYSSRQQTREFRIMGRWSKIRAKSNRFSLSSLSNSLHGLSTRMAQIALNFDSEGREVE